MPKENNNEEDNSFPGIFKERKVFGRTLIKFIESIKPTDIDNPNNPEETDDTRVISIDADWGFGKTTFMNSLKTELENKNFIVFTFNAWTNDFEPEPLLPLVQEINSQIFNKNLAPRIKSNLKKTGLYLLATGNEIARIGSKTKISLGYGVKNIEIPEIDILNDSVKRIEETVKSIESKEQLNKLKEKSEIARMMTFFQKQLITIHNKLCKDNTKKIIILIDELDRCKPTFAVDLLERVKHFFDTGKYLFIFTINSKQLINSVKQIYGEGFEETGYFRRFFDYEFILPAPNSTKYLLEKGKKLKEKFNTNSELIDLVIYSIPKNLSLRNYDKLFSYLKLLLSIQGKNKFSRNENMYLNIALNIKLCSPSVFRKIYIEKQKITKKDLDRTTLFFNFKFRKKPEGSIEDQELWEGLNYLINLVIPSKLPDVEEDYKYYYEIQTSPFKYNFSFILFLYKLNEPREYCLCPCTYSYKLDKSFNINNLTRLISFCDFKQKISFNEISHLPLLLN
jgi:hypothetical protein